MGLFLIRGGFRRHKFHPFNKFVRVIYLDVKIGVEPSYPVDYASFIGGNSYFQSLESGSKAIKHAYCARNCYQFNYLAWSDPDILTLHG